MVDFASITKRGPDLAKGISWLLERIGLLNKGSSVLSGMPSASDVADVSPISSNSLNVTRVGGLTSLVAGVGGAALMLFKVNKTTDRPSIVVAAYVSVGLIVAAALLTVAIIIAADIRARSAIATTVSPTVRPDQTDVKLIRSVADPAGNTFSLGRTYDYVLVDATAGDTVVTLPSARTAAWQPMTIARQDTAGTALTIRPQAGEMIADGRERVLQHGQHIQVFSDAQAWRLLRA